ncbi:MAG TPA: DNA polymerase III subunit gamma/tau [Casimicrobiaceae bacterium]|nr:DNA polymerase III subunit gamma/tau [Casimicrobiaceae bacterium]
MSYQALARKWRPKTFAELSGQEHVVRALSNALERGRLHHAYLLTGTRGVGKTTIARILAKSLNCAKGVTATPCGVCPACVDIDAGRFVDLLELDAASNTGIDNMREILDNARYAPTVGRYKVYLIDEVHMLSKAAFNSMLKTLEEPPEHVKFVLATTDPQKIPVTVLSRCLQFNLKLLPAPLIAKRLAEILRAEDVPFEDAALALIARVAHGSMRDSLSVLDQAIAYGAGEVREGGVRTMLGAADADYVYRIADALIARDGPALLAEARGLTERSVSLGNALEELTALFHRVAVCQTVPEAAEALADAARVKALAQAFAPESVQLAYQICVQGRADLALAPDESMGFSMTLLRLLAFEPALESNGTTTLLHPTSRTRQDSAPSGAESSAVSTSDSPVPSAASTAQVLTEAPEPAAWPAFVAGMKLSGMALQLAAQTELKAVAGNEFVLAVPEASRHLTDRAYADKLKAAIEQVLSRRVRLRFEIGGAAATTLAAQEKRERDAMQAKTEAAFRDDPFVQDVLSRFDARIKPNSIKPV